MIEDEAEYEAMQRKIAQWKQRRSIPGRIEAAKRRGFSEPDATARVLEDISKRQRASLFKPDPAPPLSPIQFASGVGKKNKKRKAAVQGIKDLWERTKFVPSPNKAKQA